jgi:CelD/BcsL family acetyltransferase involved in cellulose biosynthesis
MIDTQRPRIVDVKDSADLSELVDEWHALARRLPGTSYFQTPSWVLAWWDTVAARPPMRVACWYDDGRLAAVVGIARARQRLHRRLPISVGIYANAGSGPGDADHCGPLVTPLLWPDVNAWIADALGSRSCVVRNVQPSLPLHGARVVEETPTPLLRLCREGGRRAASESLRRNMQRYSKRLRADGVEFEWRAPGTLDAPLIDALFALHAERRAALGAESSLTEGHRELLRRLAANQDGESGVAALLAHVNNSVVAVCLGFQWEGTFAAYQIGWSPKFAHHSLGSVVLHEAIRAAAENGLHTFDFLRGAEEYKYRFGGDDTFDVTYEIPRGMTGQLLGVRNLLRARRRATTGAAVALQ